LPGGPLVALDVRTGDVRALVASRLWPPEFDRDAGRRQAGSTFKAFVWAAPCRRGLPVSTLLDPAQLPPDYAPADGQLAPDRPLSLPRGPSRLVEPGLGGPRTEDRMPAVVEMAHSWGIGDALIPPYPSSFWAPRTWSARAGGRVRPVRQRGDAMLPRFIDEVRNSERGCASFKNGIGPRRPEARAAFIMALAPRRRGGARDGNWRPAGVPAICRSWARRAPPTAPRTSGSSAATPDLVAGVWMGFDHPRPLAPPRRAGSWPAPRLGARDGGVATGQAEPSTLATSRGRRAARRGHAYRRLATGGCPSQAGRPRVVPLRQRSNDCPEHAGGLAGFLERTSEVVPLKRSPALLLADGVRPARTARDRRR